MNPTLTQYPNPPVTWVRSQNGMIAGVCDGIAKRLRVETWLVRFFWVMSVLFAGTGLLAYFILAICLPREDRIANAYDRMILGVCSRVARRTQIEIGLVRTGTVILACFTFGAVIIGYIALYFLMPEPGLNNDSDPAHDTNTDTRPIRIDR